MGKREGGHRAHRISSAVSDLPLWPSEAPEWARIAWAHLKATLPQGRDRDVWIDWYEERLRGGLRGEEYELVFANVPQGEWDRGPAAAKGWIRAHLPGSEGDDLKEGDSLKQQAALYTFRLADGRVVVAPEGARPEDQEATRDFLDESRRKAQGVARTSRAGPGRHPAATHGRATRRPPDSTDRIHPRRSRTVFAALP